MLLTNVRSIINKFDELAAVIEVLSPDIAIICETWIPKVLNNDDLALFNLPNYNTILYCRENNKGGGIAVWLIQSLNYKVINLTSNKLPRLPFDPEMITVRVDDISLFLIGIYIPPAVVVKYGSLLRKYLNIYCEVLLDNYNKYYIIIAGDLNNFNTQGLETGFQLQKMIKQPTRGKNILDQILVDSSLADYYFPCKILPPISNSDHQVAWL